MTAAIEGSVAIERIRQVVSPEGTLEMQRSFISLFPISASQLVELAIEAGFSRLRETVTVHGR